MTKLFVSGMNTEFAKMHIRMDTTSFTLNGRVGTGRFGKKLKFLISSPLANFSFTNSSIIRSAVRKMRKKKRVNLQSSGGPHL